MRKIYSILVKKNLKIIIRKLYILSIFISILNRFVYLSSLQGDGDINK